MYNLKKLPYRYDALEPYIDTHTLGLHHLKHQKNYLNKLNELLLKYNYNYKYSIEELSNHIMEFPIEIREDILFNLGGVINHDIYFNSISNNKELPNKILESLINEYYRNFENFKKEFKKIALTLKGSGYTFLVLDNKKLKIVNLKNQDNPYYYHLIPLIGMDMWEHAYYINYENKKDIYIDNYFEILDFKNANNIINYYF